MGARDVVGDETPAVLIVDGDLDRMVASVLTELEGEVDDHSVEMVEAAVEVLTRGASGMAARMGI